MLFHRVADIRLLYHYRSSRGQAAFNSIAATFLPVSAKNLLSQSRINLLKADGSTESTNLLIGFSSWFGAVA